MTLEAPSIDAPFQEWEYYLRELGTGQLDTLHRKTLKLLDLIHKEYTFKFMKITKELEVQQPVIELGELHGKPNSEVTKLKLFIEIFNVLAGEDKNDVSERNFIEELLNTRKFSEDETKTYLRKAMQNGLIFERKAGWYAKA